MIRCKHDDCKYKGQLGENTSYCNYIGHMHTSRGCDPASCDKYIPKTENNSQIGEDTDDSKNVPGSAG